MEFLNQITVYRDVIGPILDILFLAFIIYTIIMLLIRTKSTQLAFGLFLLFIVYAISSIFLLKTNIWILNRLSIVLVIVVAIVFQSELKKIFSQIARGSFINLSSKHSVSQVSAVLDAAEYLSSKKRGALFVFERKVGLKNIAETGTIMDADISFSLLSTIFEYDTRLHDGAVIIKNGRIQAAGCYLPLSEQFDIKKSFGTRHRAALGISENSDCAVVVVSEETGAISLAYNATFQYGLERYEIVKILSDIFDIDIEEEGFEAVENSEADSDKG